MWRIASKKSPTAEVLPRRLQRSASLPWPVDSTHKGPVKRKMFPFDDVIMQQLKLCIWRFLTYNPLLSQNLRVFSIVRRWFTPMGLQIGKVTIWGVLIFDLNFVRRIGNMGKVSWRSVTRQLRLFALGLETVQNKLRIVIQIKICAEYRDMLPRPRLVCQEPGLRPIGRSPGVPDKSSRGLGSMSRYSAQILICFIAYIFLFCCCFLCGFGWELYRTAIMHSALCHWPL